jgi:hypothetical protein
MTQLIQLDGEIVATVGATRFHLAPAIEQLPDGHPTLRTVVLMCTYAAELIAGGRATAYADADALAFAQAGLAGEPSEPR